MKLKVQLDAKGEWQAVEPPRETVETIEAAERSAHAGRSPRGPLALVAPPFGGA